MPGFEELWFNKRDMLRLEADNLASKALRKAGWNYTSQTPCSVWMWQKEIGGVLYSFSQHEAESVQERLDRAGYFVQFPDEMGD